MFALDVHLGVSSVFIAVLCLLSSVLPDLARQISNQPSENKQPILTPKASPNCLGKHFDHASISDALGAL